LKIYADHAATTPLAPEVLEAMRPYFGSEGFGNPSSVHARGDAARDAIEHARTSVAELVGADPEEIVFTASGSESNNLAFKGLLAGTSEGRRRLVISAIEHPSVLETARHLENRGLQVTVVPVDERGVVDESRCIETLGPDVALLSIQWVNNETGSIQPIARLAERAHACGARVHCDAVQAAGKLPIDVAAAGVDLLSLAGHKFHGPLGAAALYVKRRVRLVPLVHGGHQERGRRAGTENLPAIVGLGAAATRARQAFADGTVERAARMGEQLLSGLLEALPGSRLNGDRDRRVRSIVNLCVPGVDGEALLHELDSAGISISTGSACSAASPGPSHVLIAMGRTPEEAHASVRFSLGADHDEQIVQTIVRETPAAVARVRSLAGGSRGRHAASGTP
jgi:cysteine sulfinate desulfinase/cysteine desulfurase-like protein